MEDIEFEEFVHVRPKPGLSLNVSRRVPSLANQACQHLQKRFRRRMGKALNTRDVAELTCAVVLVAVTADILYILCPRKRTTTEEQRGFLSTSGRSHCLGNVIASFMVRITWPTSILEAVGSAELYGLAGSIFVPANSALIHTIFMLLLLEFRTKAPGARTIAQFVGHRFGLVAHILTIIISLLTSLYTLTVNITKGSMVLNAVTMNVGKGAIVSLVLLQVGALLVVARRRSCSLMLFAILTSIILICATLMFTVLNLSDSPDLGNMGSLYNLLMCHNRTDHGLEDELASGFDVALLSDGLISFIHHAVRVLLDQALRETAIKLPPNHGVLGLLLATIMAFCIPATLSVVCGLGFRALESAIHNAALLNATNRAYGTSAELAIMHNRHCSADYADIVPKPFKKQVDKAICILCDKQRGHLASRHNICRCRSMLECVACGIDTWYDGM
ncbi:unnamed protein product [Taenia asiatica]|uniref:DC_STAMP domain-containing protein n=1 Tax=Taenia asiatica TaxID=60517 RepID=A0A158RAH4_TAEAS|nr:unnamed protein product [Taenia asiatica]